MCVSPQVIKAGRSDGYTKQADVWSLGITTFELATGLPPYAGNEFQAIFKIVKEDPPQLEGKFSEALKDFVSKCLQKASA